MAQGYGFGKVILFNEHFVVYGIPAIASAIDRRTVAVIQPYEVEGYSLNDDRNATEGYKDEKLKQQKESVEIILKSIGIDPYRNPIKISLEGDLRAESGIGASAASCVAIARVLSEYFGLNFNDDKINEIAYEGEKAYHGTPSGIDNTVATYGGLIWFERGNPNVVKRIKIKPIEIVMGNTRIVSNTKAAVSGVKERREKQPKKYAEIFNRARQLVYEAEKSLDAFNLESVGALMNENHRLLQSIEVSCKELDFLVDLALKNGALGAKLTGSGLGGNMIALTPGKKLQDKVAEAIEKEGFEFLKTRIGIE